MLTDKEVKYLEEKVLPFIQDEIQKIETPGRFNSLKAELKLILKFFSIKSVEQNPKQQNVLPELYIKRDWSEYLARFEKKYPSFAAYEPVYKWLQKLIHYRILLLEWYYLQNNQQKINDHREAIVDELMKLMSAASFFKKEEIYLYNAEVFYKIFSMSIKPSLENRSIAVNLFDLTLNNLLEVKKYIPTAFNLLSEIIHACYYCYERYNRSELNLGQFGYQVAEFIKYQLFGHLKQCKPNIEAIFPFYLKLAILSNLIYEIRQFEFSPSVLVDTKLFLGCVKKYFKYAEGEGKEKGLQLLKNFILHIEDLPKLSKFPILFEYINPNFKMAYILALQQSVSGKEQFYSELITFLKEKNYQFNFDCVHLEDYIGACSSEGSRRIFTALYNVNTLRVERNKFDPNHIEAALNLVLLMAPKNVYCYGRSSIVDTLNILAEFARFKRKLENEELENVRNYSVNFLPALRSALENNFNDSVNDKQSGTKLVELLGSIVTEQVEPMVADYLCAAGDIQQLKQLYVIKISPKSHEDIAMMLYNLFVLKNVSYSIEYLSLVCFHVICAYAGYKNANNMQAANDMYDFLMRCLIDCTGADFTSQIADLNTRELNKLSLLMQKTTELSSVIEKKPVETESSTTEKPVEVKSTTVLSVIESLRRALVKVDSVCSLGSAVQVLGVFKQRPNGVPSPMWKPGVEKALGSGFYLTKTL